MLVYIFFSFFLFFSFFSYVEFFFFSYSLPLLFRPSFDHFIQSHSFFHLSLLYSRLVSPFLHPRFFSCRIFLPCTSLSLPVSSFLFFYAFLQRLFLLPLWESLCPNWISLFFIHALFIWRELIYDYLQMFNFIILTFFFFVKISCEKSFSKQSQVSFLWSLHFIRINHIYSCNWLKIILPF